MQRGSFRAMVHCCDRASPNPVAASNHNPIIMNKLIIAANLGQVRVLRFREAGDDPAEQSHLVEEPTLSLKEHVKSIHETVTDQSGRFSKGGSVGLSAGMSNGEEHHLKAEMERQAIKKTASHIDRVLHTEGHPQWILTAPQPLLPRLLEVLSQPAIDKLSSTVGADLTRSPLGEMEQRFA